MSAPTRDEHALREAIVATGREMNALGINRGKSGNVSARWREGTFDGYLITPSGMPYVSIGPADVVAMPSEGGTDAAVVGPLCQRLEVVDRLASLNFDNDLELVAPILRQEDQVGIQGGWADADRHVLLDAGVHAGFVLAAELAVEQPDDAVVLELLPDRPHQNRTQRAPPNGWITRSNAES